ncbi:MAG TPA: MOSC N-terminal beta barrel domain-containing protein [Chryseosolibacter sp.]
MNELTLTEIWIYPVKSLGGIPLTSAKVMAKGLEFDRRWMLIDENNIFMTQRIYTQMAMFKLNLLGRNITVVKKNATTNSSISFSADSPPIGEKIRAKIWDDEVDVFEIDQKLSEWFSEHLGMSCRLVNFPERNPRAVDPKYKVNDDHVNLADAYPFLLIGQSSLDDLNSRLKEPVPMNRFRPNFVFTGAQPFDEDTWREFKIGSLRFVGVKPCARCVLTTVNQDTAKKGIEPLATLSKYRKRDTKVLFGQNLIGLDTGIVKVGDKISVE